MRIIPAILTTVTIGVALTACSEATPPPTPKSVAFATHAASMLADDILPLAATVAMSDGSVGDESLITYSSSAPTIATVDSKGVVTALAAGNTTISAQVGSLHDEVLVAVSWAPVTTITFGRDTATLLLDDSLSTSVVVTNSHNKAATNAVVTYASSNTDVATVDANGRIRTFATGAATITASVESLHSDINVSVVPQFTQIATGDFQTCGITGTRRVYCWGSDQYGSLGDGLTSPDCTTQLGSHCSLVPIPVVGGDRFVYVTAGDAHMCALTSSGTAYCWGENYYGQVGRGTPGDFVTTPTAVVGGHTFVSLNAGRMHTCGIDTGGDTWCWGWDTWGQLGAGVTGADRCTFFTSNEPCSATPLKVAGNVRFAEVTGSEKFTCGRDVGGAMYCWGAEVGGTDGTDCQYGQNANCTRIPLLQFGGTTFRRIGLGGVMRCGQKSDGVIWCAGADYYGAFGNGVAYTFAPDTLVRVAGGKSYDEPIIGGAHICGLSGGTVECSGYNHDGQVGSPIGTDRYTPAPISGGIVFASVVSGSLSSTNCGISTAGRGYCWGFGQLGNLGNGTILTSSPEPVLVKLVR